MKLFYPTLWFFSCVFSFLFISSLPSDPINRLPDYSTCIKSYNAGMQSNGQQSIRFYNGCYERLYMNVCVQDSSGETKLYRSGRTVPINGNYTISTFPFVTPKIVAWNAAPYVPTVPDLCGTEKS